MLENKNGIDGLLVAACSRIPQTDHVNCHNVVRDLAIGRELVRTGIALIQGHGNRIARVGTVQAPFVHRN